MVKDSKVKKKKKTSFQVDGVTLNTGIGLGYAFLHPGFQSHLATNRRPLPQPKTQEELAQLHQALANLADEIQSLIDQQALASLATQTYHIPPSLASRDILDVYLMLAKDPHWHRQLIDKVNSGTSALDAVDQTLQSISEKLKTKKKNSLWQERISDFEDLSTRLKRHLSPSREVSKTSKDNSAIIVIADRIGPAELLDYDRSRLAGLILVEQSQTSHVAIVARSLGIPVVGGMNKSIHKINSGDYILVDGNEGRVHIRPTTEIINSVDWESLTHKKSLEDPNWESLTYLSAQTLDGITLSLFLNAGLVEDVDYINKSGAEGVGLYRTEIPFMMRPNLPTVNEQITLYKEIIQRAGRYPVTFRTLDVGGDKVLPYLERLKAGNSLKEEGPTRLAYDRPILLRYQVRALIRACEGTELSIMLPMVAEASEVKAAREVLENEIERERKKGNPVPEKIRLGAMIEVPSLVYQLPHLFSDVDFLSVGSNDLFQFFYAIDREYLKLSERYDVLSPTFLRLLKSIQDQCASANIPLSVCGEMAGRPLEALALIGLGYRNFSMSAPAVPLVKKMIRSLNYQEVSNYMAELCSFSLVNPRENLSCFAKDHNIFID
ncbi:MAG: phosphoenolpyruvate--protein phosphotransferase [Alphaproteobacteria bacterium]|nr:phosphoenolpyruvate--protein phosphotransferase [Alphaproteobacteria bacterium]